MAVFKRRNKEGEEGETWYLDYRPCTEENYQGCRTIQEGSGGLSREGQVIHP